MDSDISCDAKGKIGEDDDDDDDDEDNRLVIYFCNQNCQWKAKL